MCRDVARTVAAHGPVHSLSNVVLLTAGVMFASQCIVRDLYSLNRTSAAFWVYIGTLLVIVGASSLTYVQDDTECASYVGATVASLMIGYQVFNMYNDVAAYPAKLRERRLIQDPVRGRQSVQRLRQRTAVMLFHHAVALAASWLMISNRATTSEAWMLYLYFGGVAEASTMPYLVVTRLRDTHSVAEHATLYKTAAVAFAILFMTIRVFGWLFVTFANRETILNQATATTQALFAALTGLQMYWGAQIYGMVKRELS